MKEIKYKFWSGSKMFTDLTNVMECLKQQISGTYDHIGLHGAAFPQYTGLKDKNGVEIYEGDIVNYKWIEDYSEQIVKWDEENVRFGFQDKNEKLVYGVNVTDIAKRAEVIGNIYENPELVEKQ